MEIYLIRHAHALEGKDDAVRPLSAKGRRQVSRVGAFLRKSEALKVEAFWHSPLVRAVDTARRMVKQLRSRTKLTMVQGLLHDDDPAIMARRLNAVRKSVAVVGHEPHLSALASVLLTGQARPSRVELKKCAVLALAKHRDRWVVSWQISPELLPK
jgi:phosphohistidine phosphatase